MPDAHQLPAVTAVISTHNRRDELIITLMGLQQLGYPGLQVIVTDNASDDGTREMIRRDFPDVTLLPHSDNRPLRGYNLGFEAARTPYVLVLDDDSCPRPGTIERMVAPLGKMPAAGAVAANIIGRDGRSEWGADGDIAFSADWFNLIGCGFLIRREILLQTGGYDEHFGLYYNDLELALRILSFGHRIVYDRDAVIEHRQRRTTASPLKYRLMLRNFPLLLRSHFHVRERLDLELGHAAIAIRQAARDRRLLSALRGLAESWLASPDRPFLAAPGTSLPVRLFVHRYSLMRHLLSLPRPAEPSNGMNPEPPPPAVPLQRARKQMPFSPPCRLGVPFRNDPEATLRNAHDAPGHRYESLCDCTSLLPWYASPWSNYRQHLAHFSYLTCTERFSRARLASQWPYRPVISILTPVYKTRPEHLRECLLSVERQIYPHWQLCIVDDGSASPVIRRILDDFSTRHPGRVSLRIRDVNRGIALTSQEALDLATGEFITLLDHDDRLAPEALWEVVERLNLHPDLDWIYSDYDKISPDGQRYFHYFKPDWSPELLLAYCYVLHLCVIRRHLVQQVGGFRQAFEGAQDFDLYLRIAEKTDRVEHIPRILYSWRQSPESTSQNPDAKPYSYESGRRAIEDAMARRGETGTCETVTGPGVWAGIYRVRRPAFHPDADLVMLPGPARTQEAGNGDWIDRQAGVTIVRRFTPLPGEKDGDLLIRALRESTATFLLVAGSDITADHPDTLHDLLANLAADGVGAAAPKVLGCEDLVDHCGLALLPGGRIVFPFRGLGRETPGYGAYAIVTRNVAAVSSVLAAFRVSALRQAGGFASGMTATGTVLGACLALRHTGFRIVADGGTTVRLLSPPDPLPELQPGGADSLQLAQCWPTLWVGGDPYCNRNLRFDGEDVALT